MEWQNMEIGGLTPVNLLAKMKNNLEFLKDKIDPIDYLELLQRMLGLEVDMIHVKEDIAALSPETVDELKAQVAALDTKITDEVTKLQGEIDAVPGLLDHLKDSITVNQRAITTNSKEIGTLANLNTNNKNDLVSAANEILTRVISGDVSNLLGDLANLTTAAKDNIVNAINEIDWLTNNPTDKRVGDLTTLTTTAKDTVVNAINEVKAATGTNASGVSTLNTEVANIKKSLAYKKGELTIPQDNSFSNTRVNEWMMPVEGVIIFKQFCDYMESYYGHNLDSSFTIGGHPYEGISVINLNWNNLSAGTQNVKFGSVGTGIQKINWRFS